VFDNLHGMPLHTEACIRRLSAAALLVKTQADVEQILGELRAALEKHIRLAKDSLGAQASAIALLNGLASKDPAKA
jgi:hypothetical protein